MITALYSAEITVQYNTIKKSVLNDVESICVTLLGAVGTLV